MARMTGPYILVLHGIEAWQRVKPAVRAAARGAWRIVATTQHTAAEFGRANQIPPDRFSIIPLAIPDPSGPAAPPSSANGELRLLTAGRLTAADSYKGIDVLISAVHRARAGGANVRLTVIGDGDDRQRLQSHAAALRLERDVVRFLGAVPDDDLVRELRDCHVFSMPSRGEGFGIAYLEAMSLGRPCIAGRHGGPPEIIDDGVDGFLVEHGSVDQLASRLTALYDRPALCSEMGARAARKVRERYLFSHMRQNWFQLLDAVSD
jgi:glycosyltransferase involved in cell wall biosynthesis